MAENFKYIEISLKPCVGGFKEGCASKSKIKEFFENRKVRLIYKNIHIKTEGYIENSSLKYETHSNHFSVLNSIFRTRADFSV